MANSVTVHGPNGGSMSGTRVDFTGGAIPDADTIVAPRGWWSVFGESLPSSYSESTDARGGTTYRLYRRTTLERAGFYVADFPVGASFAVA